jgi:hypothetical protein
MVVRCIGACLDPNVMLVYAQFVACGPPNLVDLLHFDL